MKNEPDVLDSGGLRNERIEDSNCFGPVFGAAELR